MIYIIQSLTFISTRQWEIRGAALGESCAGNHLTVEKCSQPIIPVCKDKNVYCSDPPPVSIICNN